MSVQILELLVPGIRGESGDGVNASYNLSFGNGDLTVADLLVVTHNLGASPAGIVIRDGSGELVWPDKIELLTNNSLTVTLTSFRPLQGTWTITVGA